MDAYDVPLLVESSEDTNITDLLVERAAKSPEFALYAREAKNGDWDDVSAADFLKGVRALAKGLVAAGIKAGDRVAIMGRSTFEWTLIDFGIWFAGAVPVPIYESSSPSQMEWILSDSGAVALFVESATLEARFEEVKGSLSAVAHVWRFDNSDLKTLAASGGSVSDGEIELRRKQATMSSLATIVYTSGTTGRPKGCELTHRGFVDLSKNATMELPEVVHEGTTTLLFLPLAHVYARFIEVLCAHAGVRVGHQPDIKQLQAGMNSLAPDFLLAVPRVFEKIYNSAEQKAEAGGKGKIFRAAAAAAVAYSRALETKRGPGIGLRLKHGVFDALVYKKLREVMGGNVRYAISGGAPLGERLGHFYRAAGLLVLEGYGLTETHAPHMIARPDAIRIGKVGQLLPGTGIRIAEDGEIMLRGTNIFSGYWKNPKASAEVLENGWFHSGDIGKLDDEGFLQITGRKKELLVTAGGKNVAPAPMEDVLRANPLISQAVVVGDNQPFIAALISLDAEMLPIWLANNGGDKTMSVAQAAKAPIVLDELQRAVDRVNKTVSQAESIRKFKVIETELSEESGHITPSAKVKRNVVVSDFAPLIDEIYGTPPRTAEVPKAN